MNLIELTKCQTLLKETHHYIGNVIIMSLDIDDYDYTELLGIFHIQIIDIPVIKQSLVRIKKANNPDLYKFFYKAYVLLASIQQLYAVGIIPDLDDSFLLDDYIHKIKQIPMFDTLNISDIVNKYRPPVPHPTMDEVNKAGVIGDIINTTPYTVAPGQLNTIKRTTYTQNVHLSSMFRVDYFSTSSTDFKFQLPNEIKSVVSMRLASIEIPDSLYLFSASKHNNYFVVQVLLDMDVNSLTVTIPEGNYDLNGLVSYLNETYFYQSGATNGFQYIIFTIDPTCLKSQFSLVSGTIPNEFFYSVRFVNGNESNIMNTAGWILGYRLALYTNVNGPLISEALFNPDPNPYFYFSINDYQYNYNAHNMVCFDGSTFDDHILTKIPIQLTNGSMLTGTGGGCSDTRTYNGPVSLKKLHVRLYDRFGEFVNLNRMDFSFTLEMEILYEGFNFKNITY